MNDRPKTPNPAEAPFDDWLRTALHDAPEPADAGFALKVMAALPPQQLVRPRQPRASGRWLRQAEGLAMGGSVAALALVLEPAAALPLLEQALAGACLMGLVLWWSLPQTPGSRWR